LVVKVRRDTYNLRIGLQQRKHLLNARGLKDHVIIKHEKEVSFRHINRGLPLAHGVRRGNHNPSHPQASRQPARLRYDYIGFTRPAGIRDYYFLDHRSLVRKRS
jgi:hypothetical protein